MVRNFRVSTATLALVGLLLSGAILLMSRSASAQEESKPIPIAAIERSEPVDFEKEILPILRRNCFACHNATDAESDLVLETPQTILKGGGEGPAVVPKKSAESLLLKVASHEAEPIMPPEDNDRGAKNLTPEELGLVKLWIDQGAKGEVRGGAPINWQPLPPGVNPIYAVAISEDGQYAAAGRANQIFVYHVPTKREVIRLTDPSLLESVADGRPGVAHLDLVQSLAFSRDGERLASGGYRTVKLWRRLNNVRKAEFVGAEGPVGAIAVSPDGRWAATGEKSGSVRVWDLATGAVAKTLAGHTDQITGICFAADGERLVSASTDGSVRVWNTETGTQLVVLQTPAPVGAVAVLGGNQIASGGADNVVRLWTLADEPKATSGDETQKTTLTIGLRELKGHSGPITALAAVGTDGKQLISGSQDGTVRQWEAQSGKQVRQMDHGGPVTAVAVRPDGERFASAGANNITKLWNAEDGKPLADMKGDFRRQYHVAAIGRAVELSKKKTTDAENELKAAKDRKTKDDESVKKTAEAKTKAEADSKAKAATAKTAVAQKEAADQLHATATAALKESQGVKSAAEASSKALAAALEKVMSQAQTERQAVAKVAADAATLAAKAQQSVAAAADQAQKVAKASTLAAENVAAARQAGDKDPGDTTLAEAFSTAEKAAADVAVQVKAVAEQFVGAGNAAAAAAAKSKAAAQAKADVDNRFAQEEAKHKAAHDAQAAVLKAIDQAIAQTQQQAKQTEERVKQLTEPTNKATGEATAAEKTLQAAVRAATRAVESVKRAVDNIAAAEKALKQLQEKLKQTEVMLAEANKTAAEAEKPIRGIAFSPDGSQLATAGDDQVVHTWDTDTGAAIETYNGQGSKVLCLAFTGDNQVISAAEAKTILVWETTPQWTLERTIGATDSAEQLVDRVIALDFSPDGKLLATGSGEPSRSGELNIWNVEDGSLVRAIKDPHSDTIFALEFSPESDYIASCAADRFMKVFETATGNFVRSFEGHTHHVLGVTWRADGRVLASSGADNVIKIWDFRTGDQKRTISGFSKEITSVKFIGLGDNVVASSGDKFVRVKNSNDGKNVRDFGGSDDFLYSVRATADGTTIIAGGQDSVVRIWRADNGETIVNFEPPASKQAAADPQDNNQAAK